ncbi:MAG: hypothetical protein NVSMB28_25560 [Collimonas sp.]
MSCAIIGSEVAITVESMFSMNKAQATISGVRKTRDMAMRGGVGGPGGQKSLPILLKRA